VSTKKTTDSSFDKAFNAVLLAIGLVALVVLFPTIADGLREGDIRMIIVVMIACGVYVPLLVIPLFRGLSFSIRETRLLCSEMAGLPKRYRMQAAARKDPRAPFLLLRSFQHRQLTFLAWDRECLSPDRLNDKVFDFWLEPITALFPKEVRIFDGLKLLIGAVQAHGPLLAIGGENFEEYGVRMQRSPLIFIRCRDEAWRPCFQVAAQAARAILVCPASSPALLEEMYSLVHFGLLEKTIVFMPSESMVPGVSSEWLKYRQRASRYGFRLPEYSAYGMLYVPKDDFSIRNRAVFSDIKDLKDNVGGTLNKIIPELRGSSSATSTLMKEIKRLQQKVNPSDTELSQAVRVKALAAIKEGETDVVSEQLPEPPAIPLTARERWEQRMRAEEQARQLDFFRKWYGQGREEDRQNRR
jgi:hypothetical protein